MVTGKLCFNVASASGEEAWLSRFRICVPDCGDNEYRYTVKTRTYFPGDDFFLGGFADDFIDDIMVDVGLVWQDWMWDMGPAYGAIYAWGDGFMYPLGREDGWHDMSFTFGEIWGSGLLDFQYISRTQQPDKIGKPQFWTKFSAKETSDPLKICDAKAWAGSRWWSGLGTSARDVATTMRILVNTTDTTTFFPIPQEAEVSLILYKLNPLWSTTGCQDIGVFVNLTYTYYVEGSAIYGIPIWFHPYSIEVKLAEQNNMLYEPCPSLTYCNYSETSCITPEWRVAFKVAGTLLGALMAYESGGGIGGALIGGGIGAYVTEEYKFDEGQRLNWTTEQLGPPTCRNFTMNAFKTTKDQLPLSPVVPSVCSAFFFRIWPTASRHCGLVSIDLKGHLYLPFFFRNPPPDSPNWGGTWLSTDVDLHTMVPVFVE